MCEVMHPDLEQTTLISELAALTALATCCDSTPLLHLQCPHCVHQASFFLSQPQSFDTV